MVRLPHEVKDLFKQWLADHEPLKAERVMSRIRDLREGGENDPRFGTRLRGTGIYAELIQKRFDIAVRRRGLNVRPHKIALDRYAPPQRSGQQLGLF
jgi:DNA repair photolyase